MKKFTFIKNALILTITSFILRGLGVFLKVYISKKISPEGMGLYQIIFSIYVLFSTFATAGISTAVIQIINDENIKGSKKGSIKAFKNLLFLCLIWGFSISLIFFNVSSLIGKFWLNDVRTIPSLKLATFSLPFMSISSCIKGYFMAYRKVSIPSKAQIIEQIIRIMLVFFLIDLFNPYGIDAACLAIIIGDVIAEFGACIYSYIQYRLDKKRFGNEYFYSKIDSSRVSKKLIKSAGPIALNKYLNTSLRTFENVLIPSCLTKFYFSREKSLEFFGMLKGMAMPVLFFPASLLTTFSMLLIPEMAEAHSLGQKNTVAKITNKTLNICIKISILFAGIFYLFAYELSEIIYGNPEIGYIIKVLAPLVPFMYLETVVMGIMQGLNQQIHSLKYNIFDSIIRISLIYIFVPKFGMNVFLLIMIISNITTSSLNVWRSLKVTNTKLDIKNWIILPTISIFISVLITSYTIKGYCPSSISYITIGSILISLLYITTTLLLKKIT